MIHYNLIQMNNIRSHKEKREIILFEFVRFQLDHTDGVSAQ